MIAIFCCCCCFSSSSFISSPRVKWKHLFFFMFGNNDEQNEEGEKNWRWKTCVRAQQKNKCVCVANEMKTLWSNNNGEKTCKNRCSCTRLNWEKWEMCGKNEIEVKLKQVIHTNEQWDCIIYRIQENTVTTNRSYQWWCDEWKNKVKHWVSTSGRGAERRMVGDGEVERKKKLTSWDI